MIGLPGCRIRSFRRTFSPPHGTHPAGGTAPCRTPQRTLEPVGDGCPDHISPGRPCCPVFLFGHFMAMAAVADIAPRDVYFLVLRIYRSISFCTLDGRYRFPKILLQKIPAREHMKKIEIQRFSSENGFLFEKKHYLCPTFSDYF